MGPLVSYWFNFHLNYSLRPLLATFAIAITNVELPDHGKVAVTRYETRSMHPRIGWSLVEASLRTGRTHQIRVHCAEALGPIVGDRLYGGGSRGERLRLHAWRLAFDDPETGERVVVEAPPEDAFYASVE